MIVCLAMAFFVQHVGVRVRGHIVNTYKRRDEYHRRSRKRGNRYLGKPIAFAAVGG